MKELISLLVVLLSIYLFYKFLKHLKHREKKDIALKKTENNKELISPKQINFLSSPYKQSLITKPPPIPFYPDIPEYTSHSQSVGLSTYEREKVKALLRDTPNKSDNEKEPFNQKSKSPPVSSSQKEVLSSSYDDFLIDIPKRSIQNSGDSSEIQFSQVKEFSNHKSAKQNKRTSVEEQERMRILYRESYEKIYGISSNEEEKPDKKKVHRHISSKVKLIVYERDGGKCVTCGSQSNIHYDHIIPHSKGGSNTEKNIQILCGECNLKKSNKIQ